MKLYIKVENGVPVAHPALEENLKEVFPGLDLDAEGSGFSPFIRKEPPALGVYEVLDDVRYVKEGSVFTDVYVVRSMSDAERKEKQEATKTAWEANGGYKSWVFNEDLCIFIPPIALPSDGGFWDWDEVTTSWKPRNNG